MTARILLSASALTALLTACSSPDSSDETDGGTTDPFDASEEPFDSSLPDAIGETVSGLWARAYGALGQDNVRTMAVGPDRGVVAAGRVGMELWVKKLDADGHDVWSRAL